MVAYLRLVKSCIDEQLKECFKELWIVERISFQSQNENRTKACLCELWIHGNSSSFDSQKQLFEFFSPLNDYKEEWPDIDHLNNREGVMV